MLAHLGDVATHEDTDDLAQLLPVLAGKREPEVHRSHHELSRGRAEQVEVNAKEPVWRDPAHRVGDAGALVAALSDVLVVAEAVHQLHPYGRDAPGIPPDFLRRLGEAVAGDRRNHDVECVLCVSAMSGRVGERTDYRSEEHTS